MPEPVSEQLAIAIFNALSEVTVVHGYTGDLIVVRATTSATDTNPENLKSVIWQWDPEPQPAPWGQAGWMQIFEIDTAIRESSTGKPVDQRINEASADVQRALMVDRRFGGICHIDAKIIASKANADPAKGYSGVRNYLHCEYRTLTTDPRVLAPTSPNQSFFQGGAVLYLAPYVSERSYGAWRRFDNLKITPLIQPKLDSVHDDREGIGHPIDEQHVGYDQKYEIESDFLNLDILGWQMGGGPPDTYSQAATPIVGVSHTVFSADSVVLLHDAGGNPFFNIASIQAVTDVSGLTTYVSPTDYIADADALREGVLKIPSGSSIAANSVIHVSFTPTAANGRPAFDVAVADAFRVRARVVWRAADGQMMVHPDFKGSLVAQSVTDGITATITTKLLLTVLDDGSGKPAGRFILPSGALPTAGF
jgi:hypothetical protein